MAAGQLQQTKRTCRSLGSARAFTLIEAMIAMAILAIAAVGSLQYQYHAAMQQRRARIKQLAGQNAQLLLRDWAANDPERDYDPTAIWMGFSQAGQHQNSVYVRDSDKSQLRYQLDSETVTDDQAANITLRKLSVTVTEAGDNPEQVLKISTYVRHEAG